MTETPRHDGWTPQRQRTFLEYLAASGHIRRAARAADMSHEAAYQLRHRSAGAAFALGWDAALLLARAPVADALMERALDGQEDVIVRDDDGRTRTRHRHDNRLALSLLARLDRFAEDGHVAHADARAVSGAWEAFLDLIDTAPDAPTLADFLATHRPTETPVGPCQLRDAGDKEEADSDKRFRERYMVWRNESGEHRTNFPAPPGFDGHQTGDADTGHRLYGTYERSLSQLEAEREAGFDALEAAEQRARADVWRREWFGIDEDEEEAEEEEAVEMSPVAPCSDFAPCSDYTVQAS